MTNQNLQAGLKKLKAGDYPEAIAELETVLVEELHPGTLFKAKKALVKAYEGDRKLRQAWKLCQEIRESPVPEIQAWGDRALADLDSRYPSLASEVIVGRSPTPQQKAVRALIHWVKQSETRVAILENAWNIIEEERVTHQNQSPVEQVRVNWNIFRRISLLLAQNFQVWIQGQWTKFKARTK
jgi:hypothetical protein